MSRHFYQTTEQLIEDGADRDKLMSRLSIVRGQIRSIDSSPVCTAGWTDDDWQRLRNIREQWEELEAKLEKAIWPNSQGHIIIKR